MSHIVETSQLTPVITSAQRMLDLIDSGESFCDTAAAKEKMIAATDQLQDDIDIAVRAIAACVADASPFLRYRKEIMGGYGTAVRLQQLVLNLWNGNFPVSLGMLLANADQRHTRIALELIASYAEHKENDPHFMNLAAEIRDLQKDAA